MEKIGELWSYLGRVAWLSETVQTLPNREEKCGFTSPKVGGKRSRGQGESQAELTVPFVYNPENNATLYLPEDN